MDELDAVREEIRRVDQDMVVLFEKRMALSREVALCKMKSGKPVYDAAREEKNIRELSLLLKDAANQPYFRRWYQLLMDLSKDRQRAEKEKRS